ncbi:hypothetical protein P3T27_006501 [Kitasatospora sp. MAA19]|uniref:hypothetical protein n=1 Tax=Kitasatospora sp. MAA19 TaxID=3035090 RepID=UPI0024755187|nr:hypothetical protein [Kitasatospora sp. MAA19]MDH6709752.1 hypothetical protein [Kitasatospora sp. MAA19]
MARFTTARHPGLILQDDKGIWAQFADGVCETTDQATIKRLRALPQEYEVVEAKDAPAELPAE